MTTAPPRTFRRVVLYPLLGAALATLAPTGLLLTRRLVAGDASLRSAFADVASDPVTYGYVAIGTMVAFVVLGAVLGRVADHLRTTSLTDPLTLLSNRRYFHDRMTFELRRAARYDSPLSLLLIDVDRLKDINDRHGHEAGDRALCDVAQAISAICRATDVAARFGGDEFVLLAPGVVAAEALNLASRIQDTLRRHEPELREPETVSIGITDVTLAGYGAERMYEAADAALYKAKASGRDRIVVASSGLTPGA